MVWDLFVETPFGIFALLVGAAYSWWAAGFVLIIGWVVISLVRQSDRHELAWKAYRHHYDPSHEFSGPQLSELYQAFRRELRAHPERFQDK